MPEDIQAQTDQSVNTGENTESQTQEQPVKTFTQDEVTGLVAKEAKKAQEKIFKSLGFEDVKSAKEGLQQLKEWKDSQKSEAEKQSEALATKEKELEAALSSQRLLEAKLSALTLGVNAESVDDVITLSNRLVSDEVSIEDAIGQVLQKYPQFGRTEQPEEKKPTFSAGGNPTAGTNQEDAFLKALGLNN
nr:MAG TPA: Major capsid protein [Caudoviricetes sp.]